MKKLLSLILSLIMVIAVIPAVSFETDAESANVITKNNPAVVIRTSFATCGYSENWGGVHMAVPLKDKEGYVLYDVIIWEDRINLYKFPNDVEQNAEQGFDFSQDVSTPSGLKAYVKWRESFCLKSVKCKNTNDISKCSSTMSDAFIEFFKIVDQRTPSKNVILKYSGHGNIGFCGCMTVDDTKTTLQKGVSIFGQKFALIDFGTNCRSSTTDYFQVYHNFTNYMLTSQFDYGGYSLDEWDYEEYNKYDIDYNYGNAFNTGETVEQAAKNLVNYSVKFWTLCKNNLKKGKHKQSMTLTDMSGYSALWKEFYKLCADIDDEYGKDMYSLIKKYGNKKLKNLYNNFVVYYKDNNSKTYFKWDEKAYGITTGAIVNVKISDTSYVYDGKAHKPKITVSLSNGWTMQEGREYTVTYSKGRKNVGRYKVTVKLKSNYGSTETFYFTVKPKVVSVSSLSAINDGFKLKWKKNRSQTTGYQIQYSTNSSFTSAKTVWVKDADTGSKTVKKLKSKKKYYVRIRAYKTVDGKKYYSNWSAKKTVKTK